MSNPGTQRLINGEAGAALDPGDRGLRYGDGVFETLAIVDGAPALLEPHLERLENGCLRLGFDAPSRPTFLADIGQLSLPRFGLLRLTCTRGPGGRGYQPPAAPAVNRIVEVSEAPARPAAWWRDGVKVRHCATHLAVQPRLAGVKHLNRLEQVLARAEWNDPEVAEGLMTTPDGRLVEATASNLIIDDGDKLIVPDTRNAGVDGIMQAALLDRAIVRGIRHEHRFIASRSVDSSLGVMLCNSLIGVWPVRSIDGRDARWPDRVRELQAIVNEERLALSPEVLGTP